MKKQMSFVVASLFAFVLFLGVASAAITITGIPSSLSQTSGSFNINVASDTNETVTLTIADIAQGTEGVDFSLNYSSLILNSSNQTVLVSYVVSSNFNFEFGTTYSSNLNASGETSALVQKTMNFEASKFCEFGEKGDLDITQVDINNIGSGDDEEWEFLDEIEVEVSVENTNQDDSISSVEAEFLILNENGEDVTNEFFEDSDDKILDYGKISSDSEESEMLTLKISPEIEEGKYRLYVKAYKDNNEDEECTERNDDFDYTTYTEVEVVVGDKEVGIDSFEFPNTIACGSTDTVSFNFYNFDLSEKEEDMRIHLHNYDLGIDSYSDQFDLRKGKDKTLYFGLEIPENVEAGTYRVNIYYEYDYDSDDERYKESGQADEYFNLVVEGNCYVDLTPSISAEMVSEKAIEGDELILKTTITNDDAAAMFGIAAEGYDTWAQLVEVTPQYSNIDVGASQDFVFKFKLNSESVGEQTFKIIVTAGNQIIATQSVAVTVEESSFNLGSLFEGWDWTTIGIVALNIVLFLAIILVARKVLKRK